MAVPDDLGPLRSDKPGLHHRLELWQEGVDFLGRIDNLHNHRQIQGEAQDIGIMKVRRSAKSHASTQNRRSRDTTFARAKHDCFIERTPLVLIGFAQKDSEENTLLWQIPSWLKRGSWGRNSVGG